MRAGKSDARSTSRSGVTFHLDLQEATVDAENLKGLGTLLFWGALFFVMMRFGCGAHMLGRHGAHGGHCSHGGKTANGETRDPVCGMSVDPQRAAGASVHAATTYYFCSISCRDSFEKEPARYLAATPVLGDSVHGAHNRG